MKKNITNIILSACILFFNLYITFNQKNKMEYLSKHKIEKDLFIKSADSDEVPFSIKLKFGFNRIEQFYYKSKDGNKIYGYRKAIYPSNSIYRFSALEKITLNSNNSEEYYFDNEMKAYSFSYSFWMNVVFGTLFESFCFIFFFKKMKTMKLNKLY